MTENSSASAVTLTIRRPTSVRATVSEAEWFAFRAFALGRGETASDYLGELIRRDLQQNGVEVKS